MRFAAALSIAALCASLNAQDHSGDYVASGSSIRQFSSAGAVSVLWNNPGSAAGIMMGAGNDLLITNVSTLDAVLGLDPVTLAVTTIVTDANALSTPYDMVLDSNGDIVTTAFALDNGANNWSLLKISGTTISTIATTASLGIQGSFTAGLVRDIDSGNYIVPSFNTAASHPIYQITPDGASVSTLLTSFTAGGPRYDMVQDINTGNYYIGGRDSTTIGGYLLQVTQTGATSIVATDLVDQFAWNSPAMDRASSANPRIISMYTSTNLYYTDLTTFAVTSVALQATGVSPRGATILYNRNVQTVRTAPGQWTMNFSFKNQAGKQYAAALTAAGVRPGVALKDGRRIPFNLDVLTFTSLSGNLGPIFKQGPNLLDKTGEATGAIDITSIGTNLGLNVWLIAVVLDNAAPLGVAEIADPVLIQL